MNKFFLSILGSSLIIFGFGIVMDPKFYDSKHGFQYDFTGFYLPFGGFLILIGSLILWSALRKKAKDFEEKLLICPKCKTPFNQKDITDGQCPRCEVPLEDLKGFYERHPELKMPDDKEPSNNKNEK